MAVTLTWYTGEYRYELSGKGYIDKVERPIKVAEVDNIDETLHVNID